jgi:hypothetical protein
MTKAKAKKPARLTRYDHITHALNKNFGEPLYSVTEQLIDEINEGVDVPEVEDEEMQFPEPPVADPEGFEDDDAPEDKEDIGVVAHEDEGE